MGGFSLGRVFGTEVRAHWSWVFVLALITVLFGAGLGSDSASGWSGPLAWATGGIIAALIFLSVVIHELAHVRVARRMGLGRDLVVVQMLGGSYVLDVRARTPGEEARLAGSGPILSVGLAVLWLVAGLALSLGPVASSNADAWQAAAFGAVTLCLFNAFLAVVSLIPAYPMDGGRLVHALVWRWTKDPRAAGAVVGRVGRGLGAFLLSFGLLVAILQDALAGLTVVVGGWLLMGAGRTIERRDMLENLVSGLTARDATEPDLVILPPQLSLDVIASEFLGPRLGSASLVGRPDELLGLIGSRQVGRIPRRQWEARRVESAMVPIGEVPSVDADMPLWPALELLEQAGLDGLMVRRDEGASKSEPLALMTRRAASLIVRQRVEERSGQGASADESEPEAEDADGNDRPDADRPGR
jgi:Zn-dependent protease/CBS domain-containing protein